MPAVKPRGYCRMGQRFSGRALPARVRLGTAAHFRSAESGGPRIASPRFPATRTPTLISFRLQQPAGDEPARISEGSRHHVHRRRSPQHSRARTRFRSRVRV
jgi:hypothetical protein